MSLEALKMAFALAKDVFHAVDLVMREPLDKIPFVRMEKSHANFEYKRDVILRNARSPYVPTSIVQAAKSYRHITDVDYRYLESTVHISVLHSKANHVSLESFQKLLQALHMFLRVAAKYIPPFRMYTLKTIYIYLIDAPDKKLAHPHSAALGPEHVNSGFTLFTMGKPSHILIFRREERIKVLLHELIHYTSWDAAILPENHVGALVESLNAKYAIQSQSIAPMEAVTDIVAIVLRTAFEMALNGKTRSFDGAWRKQVQWMCKQAARVLHLQYGKAVMPLPPRVFHENTHTFSYYVIKAAIAHRAGVFFDAYVHHPAHLASATSPTPIGGFIMACLEDPKWLARLRAVRLEKPRLPVTLRMNMYSGGASPSASVITRTPNTYKTFSLP